MLIIATRMEPSQPERRDGRAVGVGGEGERGSRRRRAAVDDHALGIRDGIRRGPIHRKRRRPHFISRTFTAASANSRRRRDRSVRPQGESTMSSPIRRTTSPLASSPLALPVLHLGSFSDLQLGGSFTAEPKDGDMNGKVLISLI